MSNLHSENEPNSATDAGVKSGKKGTDTAS